MCLSEAQERYEAGPFRSERCRTKLGRLGNPITEFGTSDIATIDVNTTKTGRGEIFVGFDHETGTNFVVMSRQSVDAFRAAWDQVGS